MRAKLTSRVVFGPTVSLPCAHCDAPVLAHAHRVKRRKRIFCSPACAGAARRTMVTLTCASCEQPFEVKQYRVADGATYCSRACTKTGRTVTAPCAFCGTPITRKRSIARPRMYCNRRCQHDWLAANLRGPAHPRWLGGKNKLDRGADWPAARAAALARDGRKCQRCGSVDGLTIHHIRPVRAFSNPNESNGLNNLVTLCRPCHAKAEVASRAWLEAS